LNCLFQPPFPGGDGNRDGLGVYLWDEDSSYFASYCWFLSLTGCFGWDEAAERSSCEKAYPSDKTKADECYSLNKAMYDQDPDNKR
jgi:hypothetical protein